MRIAGKSYLDQSDFPDFALFDRLCLRVAAQLHSCKGVALSDWAKGGALRRLRDTLLVVRFLFPRPIRKKLGDIVIKGLPSRRHLEAVMVPALAAAGCRRMLFVGVQSYNLPFYRACDAAGIDVWSIDSNPTASVYGAPRGHFTGDLRETAVLSAAPKFDVIIFNGIIGFGVNSAAAAIAALEAMARAAEPRALLLIGWNPGLTDGQEMEAMRQRLDHASLGDTSRDVVFPAHSWAQRYPHRYEMFRFRAEIH